MYRKTFTEWELLQRQKWLEEGDFRVADASGKFHQKAELIWVLKDEWGTDSGKHTDEKLLAGGKREIVQINVPQF